MGHGFPTIVNVHHDDWLDDQQTFDAKLPRFVAIWEQIAAHFQNYNETLLFECFNEPHLMTSKQLAAMTQACVTAVRKTNPTRIIMISGLQWDNPSWILANNLTIPDDPQLMLHIHNYDPRPYTKKNPTQTEWGSAADRAALDLWVNETQAWSQKHGLPIYYGEFGVTHDQTAASGRVVWYQAHQAAISRVGWAAAAWDDCGWFKIYDRATDSWDQPIVDALLDKRSVALI